MEIILLLIRLFLFGVFGLAGVAKLLDLAGSEKAVKEFGVPEPLAKPVSIALPLFEIFIAGLLLFESTSWFGAILGLLLLLAFIGGMIFQIAKGNAPDCHCFGQISSEPVGKKSVIRNIGFAILTLFLVAQGRDDQGMSLADNQSGMLQNVLILILIASAVVVIFYLKKIFEQQSQILKRVELLELFSRDGVPQHRDGAGNPHEGLPIGSPFPDFELTDTGGKVISLEGLSAPGKPILFLFVSPTCEPCKALLPEFEKWRTELAEKLEVVLISQGSAKDNASKFAGAFGDGVILQKVREVSDAVGARWTPTALVVRPDGTIASNLAAGDTAIRELVDKVRHENLSNELFYFSNGTPTGGPPRIGQAVPEFSLEGIGGKQITAKDLHGLKTLVVFWSLTCPHCVAMMSELRSWDATKNPDEPALLVFSDGEESDHSDLGLNSPIVLDKGYKVSEHFGMFGTPSAVIVNENGQIVTETAMGAGNIWALIGKRK
jgi:peroxiredoxin/uncharacterized membrane protein YphA (DoxX/SURF4 family)